MVASFIHVQTNNSITLSAVRYCLSRTKCKSDSSNLTISTHYPRSLKVQVGGIAHLGQIIDKILLRHAGQIQYYIYWTFGFDHYLLDFFEPDGLHSSNRCVTEEPLAGSARTCGADLQKRSPSE
ncbi:MAG: DUF5069 domain-containing protein [Nitrospirota bacterium]